MYNFFSTEEGINFKWIIFQIHEFNFKEDQLQFDKITFSYRSSGQQTLNRLDLIDACCDDSEMNIAMGFLIGGQRSRNSFRRGRSCSQRFGPPRPHRFAKPLGTGRRTSSVGRRRHQGNWRLNAGLFFFFFFFSFIFHFLCWCWLDEEIELQYLIKTWEIEWFRFIYLTLAGSSFAGNKRNAPISGHTRMCHAMLSTSQFFGPWK